ncbi:pyrophosphate--fructose 6-phosphate 1-phosphotransferase subunit alpha isoform X2 [Sorghum bicolor]|uniref:pyrophosphate--fructose 6-phosphate 1-phosphotransferase subunit alpha isoform X2 n=1 Tax=Sorghum bicolor TaxID=4558 RepID=UPI000B424ECC|nr:pyrophosphate--fructose 6-phosphate 1-phosphotransferase subunit alpha isoform X2 [Sorghum bicolor]|eukprot:XP_021309756.1 pyrophosphate--fructose 6-phosphate 1-phosphotransferase subunit alpha isoform X2 [Sorghum bicolor]
MNADDLGSPRELTGLQRRRALYQPELPPCLVQGTRIRVEFGDSTTTIDSKCADIVAQAFPHIFGQKLVRFLEPHMDTVVSESDAQVIQENSPIRVGVVFSGRQSPGGHNVIWGTYDALKAQNPHNVLLGFIGGTEGLFAKKTLEITDDVLSSYKNQGGFDLLGRTVDQIRTTEQINAAKATCCDLNLDGLIIIGGVTSNSDAAQLAEIFAEHNCKTKVCSQYSLAYYLFSNLKESFRYLIILQVIGVPVTLSGDLRNQFVETTVGFDTVCKVNSQLISNVCLDAISAGKYYYFVRLMGGKASHVALECALQSHPNMVILGEEVAFSKLTLKEITNKICDGVEARAEQGKHHGVLVIPEGLIESIPEMYALIQEINNLHSNNISEADIPSQLSPWAAALFKFLPSFIRRELILHQESDNSAQLSQIDTEQLLAHLVEAEMNKRTKEGKYKGRKFSSVCHFFGSQARGSLPSNFDCNYAYVLGHICVQIIAAGLNGYMATVTNLKDSTNKWRCAAVPLAAMMSVRRHLRGPGAVPIGKPVIHPSPIDLKAESYAVLREKASSFLLDDFYRTPGGIQFEGPGAGTKPITLTIEEQDYLGDIEILQAYLDKVRTILKPGCSREILKASISSIASVNDVLKFMSAPLNTELPLYHFN